MRRQSTKTQVLYHGPSCLDGLGAAWAAYQVFGKSARYIPVSAMRPLPELNPEAPLILLDLGRPRRVLDQLMASHPSILVIDHHDQWEDDLRDFPFAVYDPNHSAAVLAWKHFHPSTPVPEFLLDIEDRDLFRNERPHSRAVCASLSTLPRDVRKWAHFDTAELRRDGEPIVRMIDQQVDGIVRQRYVTQIVGHTVMVVNSSCYMTEVCHRILDIEPGTPFAGAYYDNARGERRWSLRSRGDFNVRKIAESLGGGGHYAASGFSESAPHQRI